MESAEDDAGCLCPYISRLVNTAHFLEHVVQPDEPLPPPRSLLRGRTSNLDEGKEERRGLALANDFRMSFMRKASCTSFKVRQDAEEKAVFGPKGVLEFKVMEEEHALAQDQPPACPSISSSAAEGGGSRRTLPALASIQVPSRLESLLRSKSSRQLSLNFRADNEQDTLPLSGPGTPSSSISPLSRSPRSLQPSLSALSTYKLPHLHKQLGAAAGPQGPQQQRRHGSPAPHDPADPRDQPCLGHRGSAGCRTSECSEGSAEEERLGFARSRSCMQLGSSSACPSPHTSPTQRDSGLSRSRRTNGSMADLNAPCDPDTAQARACVSPAPRSSQLARGSSLLRPSGAEHHSGSSLSLSRPQKPTPLQERLRSCTRLVPKPDGRAHTEP